MRQALELALEALQFALHVGFPESSESQIKKGEKAYQQHRAAITAIKEALAQPEQEPDKYLMDIECTKCGAKQSGVLTVNTTPPQRTWVGLTDEEIKEGESKEELGHGFIQGALWAQDKLKEKNT